MRVLEEALVSLVRNNGAVAALIGDRIRPELSADADEYPLIVYEKEDDEPRVTMDGPIALTHAIISFDCWAGTYAVAKTIRSKLKTLFQGLTDSPLGVPLRLVTIRENGDLLEAAVGRDRQRRYGAALTLHVWYRE